MLVRRCDICKKAIDRRKNDYIEINRGWRSGIEICKSCAQPIIKAFEEQELLPKKLLKTLQPVVD